ncbi:MAG: hypothetical protein KatS3mg008_1910 [Acidimicrobiales bacterium]|nr:MAG: hypothetical protein KatS3mg008_1910 [Acidimicrobiales bacterium]
MPPPPAFCAGADTRALADPTKDKLLGIYEGFLRVWRSPLLTVAAVGGPAVGAGVNLALACDVRIASESARFDVRFLKLGLHPGGGHTWLLRRAVSEQAVAAMTMCGDVIDGVEAARVGLVWRCVRDADLMREARRLAESAAATSEELLRRTKDTLRATERMSRLEDAVEMEVDRQLWSAHRPEFAEKIRDLLRR